jgi:hypothetical protein
MRIPGKPSDGRRGVAIVEFTLAVVFLVPLVLGTLVYGFRLIRAIEMDQIVRDIGHMYIRGIDFTQPGPQGNAATLAQGFNLTSSGTSVLVLSTIKVIQQSDCDAANPGKPAGTACTNLNNPVFTQQIKIGNTSLTVNGVNIAASAFGTPPLQANDTVLATDQANTATAAAGKTSANTGFASVLTLNSGELAYVTEMFNATPELNIRGLSGAPQVYARSIF